MALDIGSYPLALLFNQTSSVLRVSVNLLKFGERITRICVEKGGAKQASFAFFGENQPMQWIATWPENFDPVSYPPSVLGEVIQYKMTKIFRAGNESGGVFPLIHQGELLGLLGLKSAKATYFQPGLVAWIQAYVDMATTDLAHEKGRADAIETAHKINRLLHSTRKLQDALPSALDLLTGMTEADAATVLRFNPASRRLDLLAARGLESRTQAKIYLYPDDGLAGQSAESRQTVKIEDLQTLQPAIWQADYLSKEGFRGYLAFPLICNDNLQGVIELLWRRPKNAVPLMLDDISRSAEVIAYSLERTLILEDLQRRNDELTSTCNATIEGLSRALELRDLETEGHTRRVSELALRLAAKMDVPAEQHEILQQGALLHDIGKLGIPDAILLKPGSLTPQEWKVMQQHPLYAYSILAPIVSLRESLDIPLYHHERWDGSGYPYGLVGEQIPLSAQLFAVVDVYDALTSDRPYRPAWPRSQAIEYLREQAGIQFSPVVVKHFLELLEDLK